MPRKKPVVPPPPKGIRERVAKDGTIKFLALATLERGKQRSLGTYDTFDEAVAARAAYFARIAQQGNPAPRADSGILTVNQLGRACLQAMAAPAWDVNRWEVRVATAKWADWPAVQLSRENVQVWIDEMANTPIASGRSAGELPTRATLHSALSLLRRVYRWAQKPARKLVTHNPADGVTIGNSTDAKPRTRRFAFDYLREDEARLLLEATPNRLPLHAKAKFVMLMIAGARPKDVWGLEWPAVDWRAQAIQFSSTKTQHHGASDYVVHPLPQLMSVLREWWLACGRPTAGLVFPAGVRQDGTQRRYARGYDAGWQDTKERRRSVWHVDHTLDRSLSADGTNNAKERGGAEARRLRRLHGERREKRSELSVRRGWRSKLGITRDVPLYALRHTCASHLLLGTELFTGGRAWDPVEVQSQLGHKDIKATERYMVALGIRAHRAAKESRVALALQKKGSKR